jgi:glycine betaine/choline ABC-type transport system substrate-binding protein
MKRKVLIITLCLSLVILAACGGDDYDVVVAGKLHVEGALMAEVFAQMLEIHTDLNVGREFDLSSRIAFQAVVEGEADVYPGYTGSILINYLGRDLVPGTSYADMIAQARAGLIEEMNLVLMDPMGFQNTYRIAIDRTFAEANGIRTMSDLAPFTGDMVFGGEHDFFDRDDGFYAMSEAYGFNFRDTVMMDVGLKYQSFEQGLMDAVVVYTTDGPLSLIDVVVLEDDRLFFPAYYFHAVVRADTLERHPIIGDVLGRLNGVATDVDMARFNFSIVDGQRSLTEAATAFISEFNLG